MKRIKKILICLLAAALAAAALPAPAACARLDVPRAAAAQGSFDADFAAESLGEAFERYLTERGLQDSRILIGWQDVESGVEWYRGADEYVDGANTYRLPLCMLYADWVREGLLSREDKVGAYVLERAVSETLIRSNNNTADALRYGVSYDHREYRAAIAKNCGMDVETLPNTYFAANQFSPRFLIGTLRTLWDNSEKYDWVIDCLKQANPDNAFGLYRGSCEIAHMIGRGEAFYSDTGVVYAPRPFLLTVTAIGVANAEEVIGQIARIAMDYAEYLSAHPEEKPVPTPEPTPSPEPSAAPAQTAEETEQKTFHFDADFSVESLGEVIERYLTERGLQHGRILIGWHDLESGEEWFRGGDTFMEAASTYKLPLAMVYADKIAAGELTVEDKIGQYRLGDALEVMLVDSNNFAAQRLRDNLSANFVEYRKMLVPYGGLDPDTLPKGFYTANQFSPRFLINTLLALYENAEKYELVLDYMKQARHNSFLSQYSGEIEVAHKYGSDENYVCDTGIVYTEHPFLITVMTHNTGDAMHRIAEIGRIAMDYAEYLASLDEPEPTAEPTPESAETPEPSAEPAAVSLPEPAEAPEGADGVREISDAATLRGILLDPEGDYRLSADIDLGGMDWIPIPFSGTLDGGGHTIYNLTVSRPGEEVAECRDGNNKPYEAHYAGLFSVTRGAEIRDLNLKGVYVAVESEDNCFVAALAGYGYETKIENCSVEGRIRLYAHGKIVGVGGVTGFFGGWFDHCSADVELLFEDRNESLHCEQFLGALAAAGKFGAEHCDITIRGYASVNGFVHTGGMTGMYCGYGLVRDRMMRVTDNTVRGKISFFENNFTRRAYCRAFAGEQVDLVTAERNDLRNFVRDERFRYDVLLSPEGCEEPDYKTAVTEATCTEWGYTDHVCAGCGYAWRDSYTPPRHTPGDWETLREARPGEAGERVKRCAVCAQTLEREELPPLIAPEAIVVKPEEAALNVGGELSLQASLLPPGAEAVAVVWQSSDSAVAAVGQDGTVTAVGRGSALITCSSADGALQAACRVTVRASLWQRLCELFR